MRGFSTFVAAAAALVLPASASAIPPEGALSQKIAPNGCVVQGGDGTSCVGAAFEGVGSERLAVSADGKSVYAARGAGKSLVVLNRDPATGAFSAGAPVATIGPPRDAVVTADGRFVYVVESVDDGGFGSSENFIQVFTRNTETGALTAGGCFTRPSTMSAEQNSGCATAPGLNNLISLELSPDAEQKNLYVTGRGPQFNSVGGDLAVFDRNAATGVLTQSGCFQWGAVTEACATARGIHFAEELTVSPDGKNVYVASRSGELAIFNRDLASGDLTQPGGTAGCLRHDGGDGCASVPLMGSGMVDATLTPDGAQMYLVSQANELILSFTRDAAGGLTQLACYSQTARSGCAEGQRIVGPLEVTVAPDAKTVYVGGDRILSAFARNSAGELSQLGGRHGCLYGFRLRATGFGCTEPGYFSYDYFGPQRPVVTPDGKHVLSTSPNGITAYRRVGAAPASYWDPATEFRTAPNQANPSPDDEGNGNVWHYLEGNGGPNAGSRSPAGYTPLASFGPHAPGEKWFKTSQQYFMIAAFPGVRHAFLHPGPGGVPVVLGWRSPFTGKARIDGSFVDSDTTCGDGATWYVDHGAAQLATGALVNDGREGAFDLVRDVQAGDFVYFVVAPATTNNDCDGGNLDLAISRVPPKADLSLEISDTPDPVLNGDEVAYELEIANAGPDAADATASLTLPAGIGFESAGPGCTAAGATVTCAVGTLASGATATRTVTTRATGAGDRTVNGSVGFGHPDLDPADNMASETTEVAPAADLEASLIASDRVTRGGAIQYTVGILNKGPDPAEAPVVVVEVPASVTLEAASGCVLESRTLRCATGGALPVSGTASWRPQGLTSVAGPVATTATAAAETGDLVGSNNAASATTAVDPPPSADGGGSGTGGGGTGAGTGGEPSTPQPTGPTLSPFEAPATVIPPAQLSRVAVMPNVMPTGSKAKGFKFTQVLDAQKKLQRLGLYLNIRTNPKPASAATDAQAAQLRKSGQGGEVTGQNPAPGAVLRTTLAAPLSAELEYFDAAADKQVMEEMNDYIAEQERKNAANKKLACELLMLRDDDLDMLLQAKSPLEAAKFLKAERCGWEATFVKAPGLVDALVKNATANKKAGRIDLVIARPVGQDLLLTVREDPRNVGVGDLSFGDDGRLTTSAKQPNNFTVQVNEKLTGRFAVGARVMFFSDGKPVTKVTGATGEVTFESVMRDTGKYALSAIYSGGNGVDSEGFRDIDIVDRNKKDFSTLSGRRMTWKDGKYTSTNASLTAARALPVVPASLGVGMTGPLSAIPAVQEDSVATAVMTKAGWTPVIAKHNVIAAGGGNVLVGAAPGVIAAGGGNVIAAGGGNRPADAVRAMVAGRPVANAAAVWSGWNLLNAIVAPLKRAVDQARGTIAQYFPPGTASRADLATSADVLKQTGALTPAGIISDKGLGVIAAGGGNVIAAGGGNVIAAGGGNVIAAGGGNIISDKGLGVIAPGGLNVIAAGGGNVIAAGGGNVIAAGGGNLVPVYGGKVISLDGSSVIAAGGGN